MQLASGILYLFAIVIAIEPSFSRGSVAVSGVHDDAFDSEVSFRNSIFNPLFYPNIIFCIDVLF